MRIFLTGATGFIGSTIIPELLNAGHQVIGLTRSDAGAEMLAAAGVEVHYGTLEEPDSLRRGAAKADAVIHTAFDHNFSNFVENCEKDKRVIAALGEELAGSDRPIVITSGTGMGAGKHGEPATEDVFNRDHPNPRKASEIAGNILLEKVINLAVMRLPQVHDAFKQGLISPLIEMARKNGVFAYVGDGSSRFAAAHVQDVARLYRLAIEKHERGAQYHAVAEEGVTAREIAETAAKGMNIPAISISPDKAEDYFGWMAPFAGMDMPASSAWTRKKLDWHPTGPTLIADLRAMNYQ